jgi:hypothetical protein
MIKTTKMMISGMMLVTTMKLKTTVMTYLVMS